MDSALDIVPGGTPAPGSPARTWSAPADGAPGPVRLVGDLDAETAPLLPALVAEHLARGRGDLHLDLSGLAFCGVRGYDALLDAQRRVRAAGGRLVLLDCDPFFRRVAALCGAGDLLDPTA